MCVVYSVLKCKCRKRVEFNSLRAKFNSLPCEVQLMACEVQLVARVKFEHSKRKRVKMWSFFRESSPGS